jgi:phosphatidylinositol alpha-1,6-mannosyltransferase
LTRHLLLTNDFPPKIGGIQTYLWELWRRLPPEEVTVVTSPHPDSARFDREQPFGVVRTREPVLLPTPMLGRRVRRIAEQAGASVVIIDPAIPLGLLGPRLGVPYGVVLHGAEVAMPGRLPLSRQALGRVLRGASLVIAAGSYPEAEARNVEGSLRGVVQVPPGVDVERFQPLADIEKARTRLRFGLPAAGPLVLSVSRLVPRKGMDVLVAAAARLAATGDHPGLVVAIAGEGRDRVRLERLVHRLDAPVRLLGLVPGADLPDLYACADVFALSCRARWAGLEQEGFGIVFLEAAAAGVPSVAGRSGGAPEAVVDGETGLLVDDPTDIWAVARAIGRLLRDDSLRRALGQGARRRAEKDYSYKVLAERLGRAINDAVKDRPGPPPAGSGGVRSSLTGGDPWRSW